MDEIEEMAQELTTEMLPEGFYRRIAEAIGPENLVKLANVVGGSTFYLPRADAIVRPIRDARIKEEFNGSNFMELSRKYDVTERWVRRLCGTGHLEGQYSMFDADPGAEDGGKFRNSQK